MQTSNQNNINQNMILDLTSLHPDLHGFEIWRELSKYKQINRRNAREATITQSQYDNICKCPKVVRDLHSHLYMCEIPSFMLKFIIME